MLSSFKKKKKSFSIMYKFIQLFNFYKIKYFTFYHFPIQNLYINRCCKDTNYHFPYLKCKSNSKHNLTLKRLMWKVRNTEKQSHSLQHNNGVSNPWRPLKTSPKLHINKLPSSTTPSSYRNHPSSLRRYISTRHRLLSQTLRLSSFRLRLRLRLRCRVNPFR